MCMPTALPSNELEDEGRLATIKDNWEDVVDEEEIVAEQVDGSAAEESRVQ